jgi:ABC-type spermidine/putrescine transport system permease subunit II
MLSGVLQDTDFQASLAFSSLLAVGATLGALLLGIPAAFAVARHRFPGRGAVAATLLSPLVFPVLITGVALLQLFAIMHSDKFIGRSAYIWRTLIIMSPPNGHASPSMIKAR